MEVEQFEIFVHLGGRPQVTLASMEETLKDVLTRVGALPGPDEYVFVGESVEALHRPDAESDEHEPADIELTLSLLKLGSLKHVHAKTVRRVEVVVNFNGQHKQRRFSPATTVATVTTWAKERFKIDPGAGADYVLAIKATGFQPRPDKHLGELIQPGAHALEFDLVKEVTPQGCQ